MQEDFTGLDTHILLDMLATHTAQYTKLMSDGSKDEFEISRLKINLIQQELHFRKQVQNNQSLSDTSIEFT